MFQFFKNIICRLFQKNNVWSMALYTIKDLEGSLLNISLNTPRTLFNSKKLRFFSNHPHTQADPFLFVYKESLYIFFEVAFPGNIGKIASYKTKDLVTYEYLGIVLSENFHLSFPFIFQSNDNIYLLPESINSHELTLYQFKDFPFHPVRVKTLLTGDYVDSFIIQINGTYFLFTTSRNGLELFFSDNLLDDPFLPHPLNPICINPAFCRSGGGSLNINGKLCRIAQDCSLSYGLNVSMIQITEISKNTYQEIVVHENIMSLNDNWNANGSHHLSAVFFNGQYVVMTDGKHYDYFINRFSSIFY